MKLCVSATLVAAAAVLATAGAAQAGSCAHKTGRNCFTLPPRIDFASVPDISNRIVAGEPNVQPEKPNTDPPASTPYTGPMIGVSKNARAPTIGYYWSIH